MILSVLFGLAGLVYWRLGPKAANSTAEVIEVTATASVGPMEQVVRLSGQTSARNFANITAPRPRGGPSNSMVLQYLTPGGRIVKQGEKIAEVDSQQLKDRVDDQRDQLRQAENDIESRKAQYAVDDENYRQSIAVAKAAYDKALLDQKAGETRTEVERQLLALSAEEAKARYDQVLRNGRFRQVSQRADLRNLELALQRQKLFIERFAANLERYSMSAPMGGMVVIQSTFRGGEFGQIQAGDQIGPGQILAKVVDPASMQVEATVNQSESDLLRVGQPARVGLDAFPDLKITGRVYSMGALAATGMGQNYYIRTIPVRIQLEGHDRRVIPDLSAHADVIVKSNEKALQTPAEAVRHEGGVAFVYVREGSRWEKRPVRVGMRSARTLEIVEGLSSGDVVRIN
ncbi:MAG: HlyD family efflux transporter periplasmic adaptor subunit [Bryobacteraceae bacterium]|nr:HlyD family efflux transporter periplasmic adaptor subunit [Bryobacteraceae bacterium]